MAAKKLWSPGINRAVALSNPQNLQALNAIASITDTQLIDRARAGDARAFEVLVKRYEGRVAGVVIGMLGRGAEAEDVGQETFIRFYRALADFRGESAVGTYLTRIAINLSLNALQKRKRRQGEVGLDSAVRELRGMGGEEAQERREAKELVRKALAQLAPEFRSVVVLRMLEGYSSAETAEVLEVPLGTVLSRLKRGREKLKVILQKLM